LIVWSGLFVAPTPPGLPDAAWSYFAIFAAVIAAIILEPVPASATGLIGITAAVLSGYVFPAPGDSVKWGLSGFSDTTVWLIFGAFILSMGYEKTGLGRRLALLMVRALGSRTLGLGYAIAFADLVLAPGTPSNNARSAGTIYPIISNIPALYDSKPGPTARRIGAYIMWTAFASTAATSALFLTAMAPNILAVSLVKQTAGIEIDWTTWFLGVLPVAGPLLLLMPLLVYILYPPGIKRSPEAPRWASEQLSAMGPMSATQKVMASLVILAVSLWIFGSSFVNATTVVLFIICLMLLLRVVTWDDVLGNRNAWNVLVWFATLVTLADGLGRVGFVNWAAEGIASQLTGLTPALVLAALVAFNFLIHYLFASLTAHTVAILPVVLAVGQSVPGMPVESLALLLCYSLGLMGIITPYATGPAPVYYACGYVSRQDFWRLGFIFGMLFLITLLLIDIPYLDFLLSTQR
jgi:anion transporter